MHQTFISTVRRREERTSARELCSGFWVVHDLGDVSGAEVERVFFFLRFAFVNYPQSILVSRLLLIVVV